LLGLGLRWVTEDTKLRAAWALSHHLLFQSQLFLPTSKAFPLHLPLNDRLTHPCPALPYPARTQEAYEDGGG
jgi:hypothetical protein